VYCLGSRNSEGGFEGLRGSRILSNPSGKIQRLGLFEEAIVRIVDSWS
jgi:hypothetical protein